MLWAHLSAGAIQQGASGSALLWLRRPVAGTWRRRLAAARSSARRRAARRGGHLLRRGVAATGVALASAATASFQLGDVPTTVRLGGAAATTSLLRRLARFRLRRRRGGRRGWRR